MIVALFCLAAAGGGVARYLLTHYAGRDRGTLAANGLGSLMLGALATTSSPDLYVIAGTGFCGALTTWSALALIAAEQGPPGARTVTLHAVTAGLTLTIGWSLASLL